MVQLNKFYLSTFDPTKHVLVFTTHQATLEECLFFYKYGEPLTWYVPYCGIMQVKFLNPEQKDQSKFELVRCGKPAEEEKH